MMPEVSVTDREAVWLAKGDKQHSTEDFEAKPEIFPFSGRNKTKTPPHTKNEKALLSSFENSFCLLTGP